MENEKLEHSKDKSLKIRIVFIIMAILVTLVGSTFAYWSWQSNTAQRTAVNFTTTAGFSCSADGGGNISPGDMGLEPTTCTNSTYAIKRTVTVSPTITNADGGIYMDLWLKVNSIGSGLAASQNFKYALTTSASNCTTGIVVQGNFNGATTNTQKTLLHNKTYSQTVTETYYLWIWLDAAETSTTTQNQTFNVSLGGACTNQAPNYVYTANVYDENVQGGNEIYIGQPIPSGIIQYNTPEAAMAAFKTNFDGVDIPFFFRHIIDNNNVVESYVGFVITPTMASANPGMTAGTYYLQGGDGGTAFFNNAKTMYDAFGSNCESNPYTTTPSTLFHCRVPGIYDVAGIYDVEIFKAGGVSVSDKTFIDECFIGTDGSSNCDEL